MPARATPLGRTEGPLQRPAKQDGQRKRKKREMKREEEERERKKGKTYKLERKANHTPVRRSRDHLCKEPEIYKWSTNT